VRVAIDFEAEGLLDGASDREARLELLQSLEEEGFGLDELRQAAAQDRLALLPVERVLAGEGKLYTREELAEKTGLDAEFSDEAARALGVPVREPGERAITEEEVELSRNAKTLLDAGLNPESFLELTAVMSRSMRSPPR
jgi:adenylate cyclase